MVGVVDLDDARPLQMVGVDDAAIILMMFLVQQGIDLAHESGDVFGVGGSLRTILANGVEIPAGCGVEACPRTQLTASRTAGCTACH
jgi:hypothetical protein